MNVPSPAASHRYSGRCASIVLIQPRVTAGSGAVFPVFRAVIMYARSAHTMNAERLPAYSGSGKFEEKFYFEFRAYQSEGGRRRLQTEVGESNSADPVYSEPER